MICCRATTASAMGLPAIRAAVPGLRASPQLPGHHAASPAGATSAAAGLKHALVDHLTCASCAGCSASSIVIWYVFSGMSLLEEPNSASADSVNRDSERRTGMCRLAGVEHRQTLSSRCCKAQLPDKGLGTGACIPNSMQQQAVLMRGQGAHPSDGLQRGLQPPGAPWQGAAHRRASPRTVPAWARLSQRRCPWPSCFAEQKSQRLRIQALLRS